MKIKNIIFIAPPAAGKGTISDYLVERFGYIHISTGDILRNMAKSETELGKRIAELMKNGEFIGDDIILPAFKEELEKIKDKPFILDGMPRKIEQAEYLDTLFKEMHIENYIVISLKIRKELLEKRVAGRRVCEHCKCSYNSYFDEFKPKRENICDKCEQELIAREDDSLDIYQERYKAFQEQTAPLLSYYKDKGKLIEVNAEQSQEEIKNEIKDILEGE